MGKTLEEIAWQVIKVLPSDTWVAVAAVPNYKKMQIITF